MFVVRSLSRGHRGHVHIAKCGGVYIRTCCEHLDTFERVRPSHRRQPLPYVRGPLAGIEWSAVIRHPVDRFRSLWQWHTQPGHPYDTHNNRVYLQGNYWVDRDIFLNWNSWMDYWWDHPIPDTNKGMWNPQLTKITHNTHLFRFETQLDECVRWMGGTPRSEPINVSRPFEYRITPVQRSRIELRYPGSVTLWESLPR